MTTYKITRNDGKPGRTVNAADVDGDKGSFLVFVDDQGLPVYMIDGDRVDAVETVDPAPETDPAFGTEGMTGYWPCGCPVEGLQAAARRVASAARVRVA